MTYANKFIKSKGQDCTIERSVPLNTKVSIKRSTNGTRDLGAREALWQGLIPIEDNLLSGEYLTIEGKKYLVQTVSYDHASKESAFYCAKCNAIIEHKRYVDDVDENFNPIQEWKTLNSDVGSYMEVVTYRLRQVDPGLLDSTKYTFDVSKDLGVELLDRFVFNGENLKIDSIAPVLDGVSRLQASPDVRE